LLDFGLARLLEEEGTPIQFPAMPQQLTVTSGVVGTPAYLSPEAILGETPHPDFDLWSLSLTLYEAATGQNPFLRPTVTATLNAILAMNVPDPRELRSDCPEGLSKFLVESLSRQRELRPRSAQELASRLQGALTD
jgi:serine/threonine-protein kinase